MDILHVVGQALLNLAPSYQALELFYWVRETPQASAELDYIWQNGNRLIPIEVKAGKAGRLKSLHYFFREKPWSFAVRFNTDLPSLLQESVNHPHQDKPLQYQLLSLPFYFAKQLECFTNT